MTRLERVEAEIVALEAWMPIWEVHSPDAHTMAGTRLTILKTERDVLDDTRADSA